MFRFGTPNFALPRVPLPSPEGDGDGGGGGGGGNDGATDTEALTAVLTELNLTPAELKSRLADSRKWENRAKQRQDYDQIKAERDELRRASQTSDEQAAAKAVEEATRTAEAAAVLKYAAPLVQAKFQAILAGRGLPADRVATLTEHLATGQYLNDDGDVDTEALTKYADAVAPAPSTDEDNNGNAGDKGGKKTWPDMGGGRRRTSGSTDGAKPTTEQRAQGLLAAMGLPTKQ